MKLNILDLNKLKCFQVVAAKGSLLEGAKELNLTPSAVYQSIKKLEGDIKQHLFYRSGKKYILTESGHHLQEIFEKFLWDFDQFQELSTSATRNLQGEIRVGLPLNFSKTVFIPILKDFNEQFPLIKFNITIAEPRRLCEQLVNFELDFIITDDTTPSEYLSKVVRKEVFKEELVLVCSNKYYKENENALKNLKTMRNLSHLDYSKSQPFLERWYKLYHKKHIKLENVHIIDNVETMVSAISNGMGLGVIPIDFLNSPQLKKDLYLVPTPDKNLFNLLYLIQESNYINNTLMKIFMKFLQQKISSLGV